MSQNGTSGTQTEESSKAKINPYQERSVDDYISELWETPSKPAILTWKTVMDMVYEMVYGKEGQTPMADLAGPGNTQKAQLSTVEPQPEPSKPSTNTPGNTA